VLRKKGYAHFRTADVAKAAGVSRGAQLHHFKTKEKLVYATMEHVFHNVLATSQVRARTLKRGEDPLERVVADAARVLLLDAVLHLARHRHLDQQRRFRKQLMAMVRNARLPAERAWPGRLVANGMSEQVADDVLWLTLGLVRGLPCACCGRTSRRASTGCSRCGVAWSRGTQRIRKLMRLSPASGRGGERGSESSCNPPFLTSPPSGGEEQEG
jgi:AcrR family transcriptional regulator